MKTRISPPRGDLPTIVRCQKGHEVASLLPGEALSLEKRGREVSSTCRECGEIVKFRVVSDG